MELEGSDDSRGSTAEAEIPAPQQKRGGGRKPLSAEERKKRNRQVQAAFKKRRTEYIKQLEETIRVHETSLHNLQTAHRGVMDECLILRYKMSLLERILLEKGIDVQAELQRKTGPRVDMAHMPALQTPTSSAIVKIDPESPQSRPTSSPHTSPAMPGTVGFSDPMVESPTASKFPGSPILCTGGEVGKEKGTGDTNAIPIAAEDSLRSHFNQLELEYNEGADMVDNEELSESYSLGPYPGPLSITCLQQETPNLQQPFILQSQGSQMDGNSLGSSVSLSLELYDPMPDVVWPLSQHAAPDAIFL
ncbi:uncharacterized protein K444DRAFT_629635 [Hyaloscypha bicolor E]|uniref:BZIP domain-containing protein n=1 Tax=Hyaloscypha bicolor E TaxID=1095630 RepID=A0A2J6TB32_9HELO|nr:uncharacterized protein K444DRAFT_629635 [Hyaloscypha bicolor E]PMD60237.1 hypothetical protein K444DRAFT_629635 [Hyaloscypha bicolor E]